MSPKYAKAMEVSNKAIKAFSAAQIAYRGRTIGDSEFLAARAVYDKAMAAFDEAFEAESPGTPDYDLNLPHTY